MTQTHQRAEGQSWLTGESVKRDGARRVERRKEDSRIRRHQIRITDGSVRLPGRRGKWSFGLFAAVSIEAIGLSDTAALERHQPRRPTWPRLPVRPDDAALWRRRPRPPSTVSHKRLCSEHKSSSLADIARTAAFGQKQRRVCPQRQMPARTRRQGSPHAMQQTRYSPAAQPAPSSAGSSSRPSTWSSAFS